MICLHRDTAIFIDFFFFYSLYTCATYSELQSHISTMIWSAKRCWNLFWTTSTPIKFWPIIYHDFTFANSFETVPNFVERILMQICRNGCGPGSNITIAQLHKKTENEKQRLAWHLNYSPAKKKQTNYNKKNRRNALPTPTTPPTVLSYILDNSV